MKTNFLFDNGARLSAPGVKVGTIADNTIEDTVKSKVFWISKRIFDVVVAMMCLPVMLGIALVVLAVNPFWNAGSLFFSQPRTGKNGKAFKMLKFRTMTEEAEELRGADDPLDVNRITPFGRWLRATKVDELPQVFNVLLGHMSIVGPRPELHSFLGDFEAHIPGYCARLTVRPGMTGYAQITQGYTACVEDVRTKTALDVYYIRNVGWKTDLSVIFRTFGVVLASTRAN